jgi:hypothetical protein
METRAAALSVPTITPLQQLCMKHIVQNTTSKASNWIRNPTSHINPAYNCLTRCNYPSDAMQRCTLLTEKDREYVKRVNKASEEREIREHPQ